MINYEKHSINESSCDEFMEQCATPFLRRICSRLRSKRSGLLVAIVLMSILILSFLHNNTSSNAHEINSLSTSSEIRNSSQQIITTTQRPIINPYPYKYTILPQRCRDEELLIVIHSAIQYHKRRMAMRDTWLNKAQLEKSLGKTVKIVFVTGATNETSVQDFIRYENELYHDILQSNFIDHYQNNTYKALSYLRWATSKYGCPNVSLILKVDDDALLHPVKLPLLNRTIQKVLSLNKTDIYAGKLLTRAVNRQHSSKWYMSPEIWPDKLYPTWFQGLAYMITPSLAERLPVIALYTKYMFTDDVYVGILVSKVPDATVVTENSIGASADSPDKLIKDYVNGSQIFYHVPFYECFYAWYQRTDVIIKLPPPPKQKTPVWIILVIIFSPFILLFLFCAVAVLYFNNCEVLDEPPPPKTRKVGKIKARP